MKSRVLTSVVKTALLFCQSLPKASFLQEARVLSSLVHWESLSNRLEITHLLSFILDEETSEINSPICFTDVPCAGTFQTCWTQGLADWFKCGKGV